MAEGISLEELQLAARNHGMPLEALRYDLTPLGLHYLLTHYDIPHIELPSWRLRVHGLVERELSLTHDELRALTRVDSVVTMECAGNGRARLDPRPFSQPWLSEAVGTAAWGGARLDAVLELAGVRAGAVEIVFTGADSGIEGGSEQRFQRSLPLDEALSPGPVLAHEINGHPLPPQHGFPLRLVVPGWYGMTNVKWLTEIEAVAEPFAGYQQTQGYRVRANEEDAGKPLTRMLPRALLIPPGTPDFPTRHRTVAAGPCRLEGRAWSGWGPIEAVEWSADAGRSWTPAELGSEREPSVWRSWSAEWIAEPGEHELCCRATDAAGNTQPLEPVWNVGGYANNSVQRVPVTVVA